MSARRFVGLTLLANTRYNRPLAMDSNAGRSSEGSNAGEIGSGWALGPGQARAWYRYRL